MTGRTLSPQYNLEDAEGRAKLLAPQPVCGDRREGSSFPYCPSLPGLLSPGVNHLGSGFSKGEKKETVVDRIGPEL